VVRDRDFEIVRTLDDPVSLARFTALWAAREKSGSFVESYAGFPFKIDIAASRDSGRWLYRPDGTTAILSIKSTEMYVVDDPAAMNALLGIREPQSR